MAPVYSSWKSHPKIPEIMKILKVKRTWRKVSFSRNVERDAGFESIRIRMTPASPIHRGVFLGKFSAPSSPFSGNTTFHGVCAPGLPPTRGGSRWSWQGWRGNLQLKFNIPGMSLNLKILFNQRLPRIIISGIVLCLPLVKSQIGSLPLSLLSKSSNFWFPFVVPSWKI